MTDQQCDATTQSGTQCLRSCNPETGKCFQHEGSLITFINVLKNKEKLADYERKVQLAIALFTSSTKTIKDLPGAVKAIKLAFPPLAAIPDRLLLFLADRLISANAQITERNFKLLFQELQSLGDRLSLIISPETTKLSWSQDAKVALEIATTLRSVGTKVIG